MATRYQPVLNPANPTVAIAYVERYNQGLQELESRLGMGQVTLQHRHDLVQRIWEEMGMRRPGTGSWLLPTPGRNIRGNQGIPMDVLEIAPWIPQAIGIPPGLEYERMMPRQHFSESDEDMSDMSDGEEENEPVTVTRAPQEGQRQRLNRRDSRARLHGNRTGL